MSRCVVIGGAPIKNYAALRRRLRDDDFFIFCDSGLKHLCGFGVLPDLIVGDFDSNENPHMMGVETIVLPREKDDTDTVFAVKEALLRGFDDFLLLGVIGGRLDHTLGNVSILLMLNSRGKTALAVDDYSELSVVSDQPVLVEDSCAYFSLLNITGQADGICVRNAKYPLNDAAIDCDYQYGISNEVLPGQTAQVSLKHGRLLLVKVFAE